MRSEVRITKILFPACWVTQAAALYPNCLSARFPLIEPNRFVVVVASYPLEVPPFLPPVPLGSPHTPRAINSRLSCHRKKGKDRGILLQPGLCQPYPIPGMPLCSQEPVGGWKAAQG